MMSSVSTNKEREIDPFNQPECIQPDKGTLQFIGSIQILCQAIQDKWFLFKASHQWGSIDPLRHSIF